MKKISFVVILLALTILVSTLNLTIFAQKEANKISFTKQMKEIPLEIRKRITQFIEDMRFDSTAPNWVNANLDYQVIQLYRPDIDGVAYYEFSLTNLRGEKVGFITVSNGRHDKPIVGWSNEGISPAEKIIREAEKNGSRPAKIYKLDELTLVAEDESGRMLANSGTLPMKIVGQEMDWLDREIEPTKVESYTETTSESDGETIPQQQVKVFGELENKFRLEEWKSWEELKEGYAGSYAVMNESLRRDAQSDWKVEDALAESGEGVFANETLLFGTISENVFDAKISVGDSDLVNLELVKRDGINPLVKVSTVRPVEREIPIELTVFGDVNETFKFTILPESLREKLGEKRSRLVNQELLNIDQKNKWYGFGSDPWGAWYAYWAAHHNDQRNYGQIPDGVSPNTSNCYSGCGATAWAMLFGWGDHRAAENDPTWSPRWGIYRQNGGYGADAHAPTSQDAGVRNMTWEIRNYIGTFCWNGSGATYPATMWLATFYLSGRTYTTLSTSYNGLGFGLPWLRNEAANSIIYDKRPAILGIGFFSHYPLAYGYQVRSRRIRAGFWYWYDYDRQFYVNYGWSGSNNQWIGAHTWFVGRIYPNAPTQTKQIIAKHSNKCLDVSGGSGDDGANVHQWGCHGGNNQKWRIEPVQTVGNYYRILAHHSGKALDVAGISTADNANVHQWEWWMGNNQLWELIPRGEGYYQIRAKHSNKCLDISGASTANGANVMQYTCHSGANQLFKLVP